MPKDASIESMVECSFFPQYVQLDSYRTLSASQIPMQFRIWLQSFLQEESQIFRIGCSLHEHLASAYQRLWKLRCSKMTTRNVDFQSRFSTFARPVPLHELNDDDFAANLKLSKLASKNPTKGRIKRKKKHIMHAQVQFSSAPNSKASESPIHVASNKSVQNKRKRIVHTDQEGHDPIAHSTPSTGQILPSNKLNKTPINKTKSTQPSSFTPRNNIFTENFTRFSIDMDGNCLFRSVLVAQGLPANQHMYMRRMCVRQVAANWNKYSLYANFCHKPDRPEAPSLPVADPLQFFPNASSYCSYMLQTGKWGTQLEINVLAEVLQLPILVWKLESKRSMDLIKYNLEKDNQSAKTIHIIHCNNNHYEALVYPGGQTVNEALTRKLARQQQCERGLIHIHSSEQIPDVQNSQPAAPSRCEKRIRSSDCPTGHHAKKRRVLRIYGSNAEIRPLPPQISRTIQAQCATRAIISNKDIQILKRLAPDGCNTLTRRPQKRRK